MKIADYSLSTTIGSPSRFQKVDFSASWYYGPFSTLVPYPREKLNLVASFKPLSYKVWILIATSAFITVQFLRLLQRYKSLFCRQTDDVIKTRISRRETMSSVVLYVIGNLLSQGLNYFSKSLAARVATGAWCCGCFFLVQIYCSTLISHLTSPNQKPIVTSFFEIADNPSVSLTVDRGFALDMFLKITESRRIKRFAEILRKDGRQITCEAPGDCLNYVKEGNAVYSAPFPIVKMILDADLKTTGTCQYTITKETFWSSPVFTLLRKNSPYTEIISQGILRLKEIGILGEWEKWYVPLPLKCMELNQQRNRKPRLSIIHLSSAFVILITGSILTAFAFVVEKLYFNLETAEKSKDETLPC